jgi:hypothetical protein
MHTNRQHHNPRRPTLREDEDTETFDAVARLINYSPVDGAESGLAALRNKRCLRSYRHNWTAWNVN